MKNNFFIAQVVQEISAQVSKSARCVFLLLTVATQIVFYQVSMKCNKIFKPAIFSYEVVNTVSSLKISVIGPIMRMCEAIMNKVIYTIHANKVCHFDFICTPKTSSFYTEEW